METLICVKYIFILLDVETLICVKYIYILLDVETLTCSIYIYIIRSGNPDMCEIYIYIIRCGNPDMFNTSQKQIYNLMKMDSYQRFLQSNIFKVKKNIFSNQY